jgi:multidrug resistance protein
MGQMTLKIRSCGPLGESGQQFSLYPYSPLSAHSAQALYVPFPSPPKAHSKETTDWLGQLAPAIPAISEDLGITSAFQGALVLSIFVLAYAIGPLFLGPLSELYGRVIVLQLSNLLYLFFNLACGFAKTQAQITTFRFFAGLGGSAPLAIGGGVLGDLFTAEHRGRAMSLYSLMPLLGPCVGPIIGAFITARTTWRWIFYATTLADAAIQLAGVFFLQETYAPVLLHQKRNRLVRETGDTTLRTEFDHQDRSIGQKLRGALTRPFRLLATQLIVQVLAVYMMFLYGLLYLQFTTFPSLWTTRYHESVEIGGLNFLAPGVGLFLGAQLCAPLQDRIYVALKKRYNVTVGRPEFRIPMMIPGALSVPFGLLIYGWSAQKMTHWIVPDIGVAIFNFGVVSCVLLDSGIMRSPLS